MKNKICIKDHSVHALSQWETTLHCNVVSQWLGAYTKWSLLYLSVMKHWSMADKLCDAKYDVNSLWPSGKTWHHTVCLLLIQVMAWCYLAASHFLSHYWFITSYGLLHSHEDKMMFKISVTRVRLKKNTNLKSYIHILWANKLEELLTISYTSSWNEIISNLDFIKYISIIN